MRQLAACDPQVSQVLEQALAVCSIPFKQNSASVRMKAFRMVFLYAYSQN